MEKTLSKLNKVELRSVWGHEAIDFTSWLARQENLDILSEEIGVNIKLIEKEANVGKFSVDILAEEESLDRKIIIENQLEATNHDHLGKIITYASGYDAKIIIWIVKDVREEHQKAIEWLNEHTDENISFFLIKIELWQINNSNPAPKFEIIVSPNEWAKTFKTSPSNRDFTDTKLKQLAFWDKFKSFVQGKNDSIRLQTPKPQSWYVISIGSSEANIVLTINSRENLLVCVISINKNKDLFDFLKKKKDEIEKEIGESAIWRDDLAYPQIFIEKNVPGIFNIEKTEEYFEWFYEKTLLFQKVFRKYIKEFKK